MRYTNSTNYSYVPPPSSDPYRYARPAAPAVEQVYTPIQRTSSKRDAPLFSIKQDLKYNRYHTHHFSAEDAYPPHPRTFSEYHARYAEREQDQKVRRKSSRKRKPAPAPPPPVPPVPTYYQPQKYNFTPSHGSRRSSNPASSHQMESVFYLGTDHHPPMFRSRRSKNPYSPPPSPPPWYASGGGYSQQGSFDMNRPSSPPAFDQRSSSGRHRLRRVARFLFGW